MPTFEPKAILLTGGAGFIGSNVLVHLVSKYSNYLVVCLDVLDTCATVRNFEEIKECVNFVFVQGSILDAALVKELLHKYAIDTIMHFAAQTHVDNSFRNSIAFTEVNVKGTHVLLQACQSVHPQIQRFIHVSTDEVYGESDAQLTTPRLNEQSYLHPTNPYAATKVSAEYLVKSYG